MGKLYLISALGAAHIPAKAQRDRARRGYEQAILYRTNRDAVSGITLGVSVGILGSMIVFLF